MKQKFNITQENGYLKTTLTMTAAENDIKVITTQQDQL